MSNKLAVNPVFISIQAKNQGLISEEAFTQPSVGNIFKNGHENEILVKSFKHEIYVPRDAASGQRTGDVVHGAMTFTKLIDKSSPLLFNALNQGEPLDSVSIKWYRPSISGKQEHFYTTELADALIVNITTKMGLNGDDLSPMEEVSISYRKIEHRHEISSTSGEHDYRSEVTL